MSQKKYLAIGDIHGCLKSLQALLKNLDDYSDRQFIFLGDYIDRGPDSKGVVDFLLEYQKKQDCIFLRGNHEQMLLDAYEAHDLDLWLMNGGRSTLESYGATYNHIRIPESHIAFYQKTRMYYDTPDYFFVHAGLSPKKTIEKSLNNDRDIADFLWERSHLNASKTPWEKMVVFGHTPRPTPIRKSKMLGLDTGCVYESVGYGKLTAALLPEIRFVQQVCLDK